MVRAILEGRKSQTRRVMKPQLENIAVKDGDGIISYAGLGHPNKGGGWTLWPNGKEGVLARCPYGVPGDRLWVRETWRTVYNAITGVAYPVYRADGDAQQVWESPIFMPRCASRLTLEVTGVRVERQNEISEGDAMAEGINDYGNGTFGLDDPLCCMGVRASVAYMRLWEALHGPGSWAANPWVWVVEFRRLED